MRDKRYDFDPANADDNGIADDLPTGTSWSLDGDVKWLTDNSGDSLAHRLVVTTAGNETGSTKTLTLTGTDADGKVQTDTVTLPSATTVETAKYFLTITSASSDVATIDTMDIGWVDEFASKTIPLDYDEQLPPTAQILVTGTIGFDIETTLQNPFDDSLAAPFDYADQSDFAWLNDANFTAKSASLVASLGVPGNRAMRFVCNSYTDTAEIQMWITQPSDQ